LGREAEGNRLGVVTRAQILRAGRPGTSAATKAREATAPLPAMRPTQGMSGPARPGLGSSAAAAENEPI